MQISASVNPGNSGGGVFAQSGNLIGLVVAKSSGSDVEGQATAVYLAHLLKDKPIKISRPAQGLPAGSDLSYADPATIAVALNGRVDFTRYY